LIQSSSTSRTLLYHTVNVDLLISSVDLYPLEDEKLRATKLERRRGGNVPNSLEVLQQLLSKGNHPTSITLVSVLPGCLSTAVDQIRSSLGHAIDLSHCLYRESSSEAPSSYIIRSLATDSRTIVNYNDLEEMNVTEFENVADKLASSSDGQMIYHFEGRIPDVTVKCMDYVRNYYPEAKISVECEKPNREGLQALAQKADIVFYSKSWGRVSQVYVPSLLISSRLFFVYGRLIIYLIFRLKALRAQKIV
jgi:ketohexokinase